MPTGFKIVAPTATRRTPGFDSGLDTSVSGALWTFRQAHAWRRSEHVNAVCIGSSTMWGQNAGQAPEQNLVNSLAHSFRNNCGQPQGGRFFSPPHMSGTTVLQTSNWTAGSTGTYQNFPNGLQLNALQMGGTRTISQTFVNCTGIEIYFQQGGSVGAFTVAWTGTGSGSQLVTPDNTKFSARGDGVWRSPTWTRETRTITISVSSTILNFNGMYVFDGDNTAGVRFINAAYPGTTASSYIGSGSAANFHNRMVGMFDPRLLIYMVGSNDWGADTPVATYKANVKEMIRQARASCPSNPSVLLMHQYQRYTATDPDPWSTFGDALRQIAAEVSDVDVLDISPHFPTAQAKDVDDILDSDGYHPTRRGLEFIGQLVADHLAKTLGMSSPPKSANAPAVGADPSTLSGLVSAWRTSDLSSVNGTAIATWSRYAGSQNVNLVQATGGNQPLIKANAVGGVQSLVMSTSSSDYMKSTAAWSPTLTGAITVLMVAKLGNTSTSVTSLATQTGDGYLFDGRTSTLRVGAQMDKNSILTLNAGATAVDVVSGGQRWTVYGIVYNGASSKFQTDILPLVTVPTLTNGANYGLDGLTLGADNANANIVDAEYAEILVFNRALTDNELDTSIKYLARKYGLDGVGKTSV